MRYHSTRDNSKSFSLKDAALMGLAPDGGLFMPDFIPQADMGKVRELAAGSFPEMAAYLAGLFFDEFSHEELLEMTSKAFSFDIPLKNVSDQLFTLELFHGPTFAFKDIGAGFMGQMMGRLAEKGKPINVIAATSGDTGSAVANGFYKVDGVNVTVLFPKGKVSPFQESQMTTLGHNIHAVAVDGCFDDCQALVKQLLADKDFHDSVRLTSANSINILRWIPQSFYYFWAYCRWTEATGRDLPTAVVPSGNLGNLAAGILAQRMGLPLRGFVAANNTNDTFARYLWNGEYLPSRTVATVANAMDVSAPSNFERIRDFYGGELPGDIAGYSFSDDEICAAMGEMLRDYGYKSCPHSACGYLAAKKSGADGFWLSTAHYAKFNDIMSRAAGKEIRLIEPFLSISQIKGKSVDIPVDAGRLKDIISSY